MEHIALIVNNRPLRNTFTKEQRESIQQSLSRCSTIIQVSHVVMILHLLLNQLVLFIYLSFKLTFSSDPTAMGNDSGD